MQSASKQIGLILLIAAVSGCMNADDQTFQAGEWAWDITITRDGQDFLDQTTDCVTRSEGQAGFPEFVRGFAADYQCLTKSIDMEPGSNRATLTIGNCAGGYVDGIFQLRRQSKKRFNVDGNFRYRAYGEIEVRQLKTLAKHTSNTCRLQID
ncbi:MAG: hypothetical protein AAGI14_06935 [Pseudomonadota bacterium]